MLSPVQKRATANEAGWPWRRNVTAQTAGKMTWSAEPARMQRKRGRKNAKVCPASWTTRSMPWMNRRAPLAASKSRPRARICQARTTITSSPAARPSAGAGGTRTTAHRWYHAWQTEGRRGLNAVGRAGRKPRLDRQQLARVEAALLKGPAAHGFATNLWTLPRIAAVIARGTGVRYHPAHVWRILQGLNWSLQRPARQARERDEAAIGQWRRQRWPQVKKTRGAGTPG